MHDIFVANALFLLVHMMDEEEDRRWVNLLAAGNRIAIWAYNEENIIKSKSRHVPIMMRNTSSWFLFLYYFFVFYFDHKPS